MPMPMKTKDIYEFDHYCLDAQERQLVKDGARVKLRRKALDVLLALVESGGCLLTKQDLKDKVWLGDHVEDHTVDVYIAAVRKKLGLNQNGNPYIETVHGEGYRIAVT